MLRWHPVTECCTYTQLKSVMLSLTEPTRPRDCCIHHHAGLVALHGAWAVKLLKKQVTVLFKSPLTPTFWVVPVYSPPQLPAWQWQRVMQP